jgi:hypothetical protein
MSGLKPFACRALLSEAPGAAEPPSCGCATTSAREAQAVILCPRRFHNPSFCDRCRAVAALRYGIGMLDCVMIAVAPVAS